MNTADPTTPGSSIEFVLPRLVRMHERGERVVLATLVAKLGSAPRPLGSQMAISSTGDSYGYITGGCAEAAIVAEAQLALEAGRNRVTRFGQGSCYLDIVLPCGAGIDVHFDVNPDIAALGAVIERMTRRQPTALATELVSGTTTVLSADEPAAPEHSGFVKHYVPPTLLQVFGKGPIVTALARQATAAEYEVRVISPEPDTLESVAALPVRGFPLQGYLRGELAASDPWTANVTLFHEHDLETDILAWALRSDSAYVGALGSRRTHEERVGLLRRMGFSSADCARICAPIGLDIGATLASEIAISILAEITAGQQPPRFTSPVDLAVTDHATAD